jgi:arginase family enzyme
MDVLDPAFASAVQNPEPNGLDMHTLLEVLFSVCDSRVAAFDLVEVAPHYDSGVTAIQAARVLFEVLCYIEKAKRG